MINIEWESSHYHTDGRKRSRPKASTVHGWLAKMRGTFTGNERLRSQGMREMREAAAVRRWKRQQPKRSNSSGGFSLFGSNKPKRTSQRRPPSGRQASGRSLQKGGPGGHRRASQHTVGGGQRRVSTGTRRSSTHARGRRR